MCVAPKRPDLLMASIALELSSYNCCYTEADVEAGIPSNSSRPTGKSPTRNTLANLKICEPATAAAYSQPNGTLLPHDRRGQSYAGEGAEGPYDSSRRRY